MAGTPLSQSALAQRVEAKLVGWRLNRLRSALRGPLVVVCAGALRPVAALWARLHEAHGHPAWTVTPYDFIERSMPQDTQVLILSRGGRHHDILAAVRHAHRLGCSVHAVVESAKAPLVSIVRGDAPDNELVVLAGASHLEDPAQTTRLVPTAVLAAALYTQSGPHAACFSVRAPQKSWY